MRAVWGMIGINTAVFCAWQYARAQRDNDLLVRFQQNATCSWENVKAGRYHTLITSAFTHHAPQHFLFNMVSFYAFGSVLSSIPGVSGAHIISLAIGSAIAGSLAWLYQQQGQISFSRNLSVGRGGQLSQYVSSAIGASGMVMGLSGAATCLAPFTGMNMMFIPVPISLWMTTALYAAVDIFYLESGDGIGHSAHLGGAVFGAFFYFISLRRFGGIWHMMGRGMRRR